MFIQAEGAFYYSNFVSTETVLKLMIYNQYFLILQKMNNERKKDRKSVTYILNPYMYLTL